jgi:hypothetical protein
VLAHRDDAWLGEMRILLAGDDHPRLAGEAAER